MNRSPRIVVVGSANVDLTTFVDRLPEAGETIFGRDFHLGFGGKGANQAVAARKLGSEVSMIARIGDDLFGPATLANFEKQEIDSKHVLTTPGVSSGVAPIFVESSGQNRILVVKGANDRLSPQDIDDAADVIRHADIVITQLEIPLETVYYVLRFASQLGIRTILNPAPGCQLDFEKISCASYVIPNETETEALTGLPLASPDDYAKCAGYLSAQGVQCSIITLGANGALLVNGERHQRISGYEVQAVDTSGAGDAFIGSFAHFLAMGSELGEAIRRANLYAALSTLSKGTQRSFVERDRFETEWKARNRN